MSGKMTSVVMIAFNRPDMVRRMLSSYVEADGAATRDVVMFIDGPRDESDRIKCEAVATVADEFKRRLPRLRAIRRPRNLGCRASVVDAVTTVMKDYGRAIVIEDDVLISKTFLRYMDDALEFYKDDKRIWCINGFRNLGVKLPKDYVHDIYLDQRNWSWGWGGWYDRWSQVDFDMKFWPGCHESPTEIARLDACGIELWKMAEDVYAGRLNTWDIQCTVHIVLNGLYTIEPRRLLSKSIGFGSDSTHMSSYDSILASAKYYNLRPRLVADLQPDERILRQLPHATRDVRLLPRVLRKLQRIYASFLPEQVKPVDVV